MERITDKNINAEFMSALFAWQGSPENPVASQKINQLLEQVNNIGANLSIKINAEVFATTEGATSIQKNDLNSMAKFEGTKEGGYYFVFSFKSKKDGRIRIKALDDYLIFADNKMGEMVPSAFFRPHEIISFESK